MPTVFFSYAHADEQLRDQLEKQLAMLKRQGVINTWHDRRIAGGSEWAQAIDSHVDTDQIILLLVSPDFLASEYCYDREMARAMERHERGEAIVIPVILRACDWHGAPFGKLQATPKDGKPVSQWPDQDQAFLEVARTVRAAAEQLDASTKTQRPHIAASPVAAPTAAFSQAGPRSSNLRLAKTFTERDHDRFRLDAFEFIAKFFENSLAEIGARNAGVEGTFRRIDANRFTAAIYREGKALERCTIFMGTNFANGIAYVSGESGNSNSYNELMSVEADEHAMYLCSMGMAHMGRSQEQKLTPEGAAETYWEMLMQRLQRR